MFCAEENGHGKIKQHNLTYQQHYSAYGTFILSKHFAFQNDQTVALKPFFKNSLTKNWNKKNLYKGFPYTLG